MAGERLGASPSLPLLPLLLLLSGMVGQQVVRAEETCLCYPNFTQDIRDAISAFADNELPTASDYEYIGAKLVGSDYKPCLCDDITRVVTTMTVPWNASVQLTDDQKQKFSENMTSSMNQMIPVLANKDVLLHQTVYKFLVTVKETTDTTLVFNVTILLRGRDASYKDKIETSLREDGSSPFDIDGLRVVQCGDPPAKPTNGNIDSTEGKLAGATAYYYCNDGDILSTENEMEASVCSPEAETWSDIPANLACEEDMRCMDDPPEEPPHSSYNWRRSERKKGTVVTYTCQYSYKSSLKTKPTSECKDKAWTSIPEGFKCEFQGCKDNPPQVSSNIELEWNFVFTENAKATYSCKDGYIPLGSVAKPQLVCKNKTWGSLPQDFSCIKNDGNAEILLSGEAEFEESSYLLSITAPSLAGLIVVIIFCLCCTRTDSPLFHLCRSKERYNKVP